jgi:hypothetical protein
MKSWNCWSKTFVIELCTTEIHASTACYSLASRRSGFAAAQRVHLASQDLNIADSLAPQPRFRMPAFVIACAALMPRAQSFVQHLNAPPIAVTQTRHVPFARQPIHETQMPRLTPAQSAREVGLRRFD